ncbi:MAG: 50S ribosomal protein L18 [Candidatus Paceibacterota bacterium]|jgi:large subunit ribosomal protein L18
MKNKKIEKRIRLKKKIRTKIFGTTKCPRLSVFRSNNYIYAQVIDDLNHNTLIASSDMNLKKGTKTERAKNIGEEVAKKAIEKGIKTCVFDRNGFKYTGRIKALADGARTGGLKF